MKQKCVFSKAFQILREEKDFLGSEHFGTEITIDVGGGPSGPQGLQLKAHFVVQSISVVHLERGK